MSEIAGKMPRTGPSNVKSSSGLGFLTVIEDPQHGLFGGYLVLNTSGRPLEFHCTAPIKPNRAQKILYGPTLEPYLFGEQIGQTLLAKAKVEPLVVCTDREPVLAVGQYVDTPVALVLPPEDLHASGADASAGPPLPSEPEDKVWRLDGAHAGGPGLIAFRLGRNRLAVPAPREEDRRRILDRLGQLAGSFELAEPFQRIREAIEEARRGGQ